MEMGIAAASKQLTSTTKHRHRRKHDDRLGTTNTRRHFLFNSAAPLDISWPELFFHQLSHIPIVGDIVTYLFPDMGFRSVTELNEHLQIENIISYNTFNTSRIRLPNTAHLLSPVRLQQPLPGNATQ